MTPFTDYHNGIYAIDAHYLRAGMAAIHLIESDGRAAVVDTGSHAAMPHAMATIEALGLTPEAVDYVILTHIHLDHAGAAGQMMRAFPNARLVVHPRGARHMIEPAKLMAGVAEVYGHDEALAMYGELIPVAADRLIEAHDDTLIRLGSRELLCLDAPGHARHHIAIVDRETSGIFTGDTFGIAYRELDVGGRPLIFPSATPVQFDPEAMRGSIRRLLALAPEAMYLTHYGRLDAPAEHAATLLRRIDRYVDITRAAMGGADPVAQIRDRLTRLVLTEARAHGCRQSDDEILALWRLDIGLNAQGLAIWGWRSAAGG